MGFKPRPAPNAEARPICVFWQNRESLLERKLNRDDDKEGWCICTRKPTAMFFTQETACGRHVTLPGRYALRHPTCPECLELLETNKVSPSDYPQDLREFLPHE